MYTRHWISSLVTAYEPGLGLSEPRSSRAPWRDAFALREGNMIYLPTLSALEGLLIAPGIVVKHVLFPGRRAEI